MSSAALALPKEKKPPEWANGLLDISGLGLAVKRPNPLSGFLYKKRSAVLFPHTPTIADVKQWGVGDCYLLAALLSILNMADGPNIIMRMMKQHESGDIFVRVHDLATLQPQIRRYEKSIILSWEHARDCLWVQMLEKVYADVARGTYSKLAGGHSSDCFRVLLGGAGEHLVRGNAPTPQETKVLSVLFANFLHGVYNVKTTREMVCTEIFSGDTALLARWEAWNTQARKAKWAAFLVRQTGETISRLIKIEDFLTFLQTQSAGGALDEAVKRAMFDWLYAQNPLAREAYSADEMDYYRKITVALRAHKTVAAGTMKTIAGKSDGRGHSGGEAKAAGMVGGHAYAVLGVREDKNHRLWIHIRNPWGEGFFSGYGRAYDEIPNGEGGITFRAKKTSSPESWLTLEDFCECIEQLYIGETGTSSSPTTAEVSDVEIGAGRGRSGGVTARP